MEDSVQKVIVEQSFNTVTLDERSDLPITGINTPEGKVARRLQELGPGWKVLSSSTTLNVVHKEKTPMLKTNVFLAFVTTVIVSDD